MQEENQNQGGSGGNDGGGDKQKLTPVPNANVKLREGQDPITVEGEVNAGMESKPVYFPDEANQRAGWYSPQADFILLQLPERYIAVKPKG